MQCYKNIQIIVLIFVLRCSTNTGFEFKDSVAGTVIYYKRFSLSRRKSVISVYHVWGAAFLVLAFSTRLLSRPDFLACARNLPPDMP